MLDPVDGLSDLHEPTDVRMLQGLDGLHTILVALRFDVRLDLVVVHFRCGVAQITNVHKVLVGVSVANFPLDPGLRTISSEDRKERIRFCDLTVAPNFISEVGPASLTTRFLLKTTLVRLFCLLLVGGIPNAIVNTVQYTVIQYNTIRFEGCSTTVF